jgi:hypothetical protein
VFAKTCVVIVAVGAFGCALLAMRQARLQAASELTQTQLRISKLDHRLWDVRAKVAEATTPTNVERMAAGLGRFRPMVPDDGTVEPLPDARTTRDPRHAAATPTPARPQVSPR